MFRLFWCFCKGNCNFEYRIRILCIKLYMGTWVIDIFRLQKIEKIDPPKSKQIPEVWTILVRNIWGDIYTPKPPRPLKRPKHFNCFFLVFSTFMFWADFWEPIRLWLHVPCRNHNGSWPHGGVMARLQPATSGESPVSYTTTATSRQGMHLRSSGSIAKKRTSVGGGRPPPVRNTRTAATTSVGANTEINPSVQLARLCGPSTM